MSKIQLVFNGHEDRVSIAAALSDLASYEIEVVNNYNLAGTETYTIDLDALGSTELEAFYAVIDVANYPIETAALIWKIKRTGKVFNLNSSFIRYAVATTGTLTKIPDGTQLKMRVEIPGFETNEYREIDLWIAEAFNPADLDLLAEIGITIDGDGGYFELGNATACKVSFSVPSGATDVYLIDDVNASDVIPV